MEKSATERSKCALIVYSDSCRLGTQMRPPPHPPPCDSSDLTSYYQDARSAGPSVSPVRDGLCPGVPGHSQAACRGSGPPGRAGLRAHSSPGRRGVGRAAQRRETDPVCLSETQSTVHKGGPRRAKGAARGTAHPHTCEGVLGGMCTAHSSAVAGAGDVFHVGAG